MAGNLFGRPLTHAGIDQKLEDLAKSAFPFEQYFAENLRMDSRVSKARGKDFVSSMGSLLVTPELDGNPPDFTDAFKSWFKTNVQGNPGNLDCNRLSGWVPEYCRVGNYDNRLLDESGASPFLPDSLLATVIDLSGLGRYVYPAYWERIPEGRALLLQKPGWRSEDIGTPGWVNVYMEDSSTRERFVDATLRCLWMSNKNFPYTPQWATFWNRFLEVVDQVDGESWVNATGTAKCTDEQWLIVLSYPVSRVSALYRPTQLEAGNFAYHYPSPALRVADFAMHLDPVSPHDPIPEMIHDTLVDASASSYDADRYALKLEDWKRTNFLCATCNCYTIGEGPNAGGAADVYHGGQLTAQRTAHALRLQRGPAYP